MRPTQAIIDLAALRHNLSSICKELSAGAELTAVVKADAYGHGALKVAQVALACGTKYLAVAIPEEGILLRTAGIQAPIFILGTILPEQAADVVYHSLIPTVCNLEVVQALSTAADKLSTMVNIMIKLDTGMNRIGVQPDELLSFCHKLNAHSKIKLHGIFTHLASADMVDKTFAEQQLHLFNNAINEAKANGFVLPYLSAANSATIIDLPQGHHNMVRPGIILYGLPPSNEMHRKIDLLPVLQLKTKIAHIKKVPAGASVSYGCLFTASEPTYLATLPIGYADGYKRHLSNKGEVLINGRRRKITGRVCMDQIIVNLGTICDANIGDEAILIGRQGNDEITATEVAAWAGTINYEITSALTARVPKVYINE